MNNVTKKQQFFYTPEEVDFVREGIKSKIKAKVIAKLFVEKFGRNEATIINKVAVEKKKLGLSRERVSKKPAQVTTSTNIRLPEGFTFSGTAKKVEISSDYFKVYF